MFVILVFLFCNVLTVFSERKRSTYNKTTTNTEQTLDSSQEKKWNKCQFIYDNCALFHQVVIKVPLNHFNAIKWL